MTYPELQIQFDLNLDNRLNVLNNIDNNIDICRLTRYGYLFVDNEDGQCYLFNANGQEDDISKVKIIDDWTFENNKSLTSIKIPDSVESIGDCAFYNCKSLKSIKIPNSVTSIGDWAFYGCTSLTSVMIPDSIKSIGNLAFLGCWSLKSIKIPDSVESIGYFAFFSCMSLKKVIFKNKTIDQVKVMCGYPWGIEDESIIKVES